MPDIINSATSAQAGEYVVLLALDPSTLSTSVNQLITLGWRPQGGVALAEVRDEQDGAQTQWAQAMVKQS